MKKITMFLLESCPYCIEAQRFMNSLKAENPEYARLEIEKIDERKHPDIAEKFDYYFVPTYYVGGEKLHEGAATLEKVRGVFEAAVS